MASAEAPTILPIFPLTGCLLLPGNFLPLNVYEGRYRNLVADALKEGRHIGMIQPRIPMQDNWGVAAQSEAPAPEVYGIGCAGRIEEAERQRDGRYQLVLRGISRFEVRRELPLRRGYRRVEADYGAFPADPEESRRQVDPTRLLAALRSFSEENSLEFDFELLAALPGVCLLNGLCAALPFTPAEKQALLEARTPEERERLLLTMMGMGLEDLAPDRYYAPPTVH